MTPRPIIIDTDPGQDDAVAILLALASPELEVRGITTVAGNVALELTQANARRICELADWLWQYDKAQNPGAETCFGCASPRSFQAKICEQSPDIKICNELAIGSKHFHVGKHKKVVESAEVSAGPAFILNVSLLDVDRLGPGPVPVLKVRMVDGTSVKSAKIFNGAMKFWFGFFQDHGLLPEGAKMEDFI